MVVMVTGNTTIAVMISQQQELTDEQTPCTWVDHKERIKANWNAKNS